MANSPPMRLLAGGASAFARKARVVIHELGLGDQVDVELVSPQKDVARLASLNPLGKIPTLETPDGPIYDSSVICEYLTAVHGGDRLLPAGGPARWAILRWAALGDGILEAGMLARAEKGREGSDPAAVSWQIDKTQRGLDAVEKAARDFPPEPHLGCIAIGCALGWLDFRLGALDLIGDRPQTRRWYEAIAQRPSFRSTVPQA